LKEIILAAPDINVQIFQQQIYPALAKAKRPITLYVSSEDEALQKSKEFHGYQRLGDSTPRPVLLAGIETIDVTGIDTGFLKHSYVAETKPLLRDLFILMVTGGRAAQRNTLSIMPTDPPYWVLKRAN
jgi:esterase/lipase superfamily enzyme